MKNNHRKSRLWQRTVVLASLLWLGLTPETPITPSASENQAQSSGSACTAAYMFDRPNLTFKDRDASHLNQLNFSFALIRDGEATGDHWLKIDDYKAFIRKHPHIRPVVSVGGWGADGFSQAAATAEGRTKLVNSILALMQEHGFTGVDIDWEYPCSSAAGIGSSPDDRRNFTLLMEELRSGLDALTAQDGIPRLLATALGASEKMVESIECDAIGRIADQINLMTYDIQTPHVASHHTALYSSEDFPYSADYAVKLFTEAGIPAEKIMVGCAFYGRVFQIEKDTKEPLFKPALSDGYKSRNYTALQALLPDAEVFFDDNAKAPYLIADDAFITYDDPVSIGHKGDYVRHHGLMGMMCWEYGGDESGELLRAMYESVQ